MTSNKGAHYVFRTAVIDELRRAGFADARAPFEPKGLPLSERLRRDHGDVLGTPWALGIRASKVLDLSGAQNEVQFQAQQGGQEFRAVIHKRMAHDVSAAYVVMPLSIYLAVLRRLHPHELMSAQVRALDL